MKCKKCGAEIPEGCLFCGICGERKEDEPKKSFKEIVDIESKNTTFMSSNLKGAIILSVCSLVLCSLIRLGIPEMDWEDVIRFVQWGRFAVISFAYSGLSAVLFDKESSKEGRLITVLWLVFHVIITFCFLLPEIPASSLWDIIY